MSPPLTRHKARLATHKRHSPRTSRPTSRTSRRSSRTPQRSPQPSTSAVTPPRQRRPAPVTSPGPYEASQQRLLLQQSVLPATPRTAQKTQELRKQLFREMPRHPSSSPPSSPARRQEPCPPPLRQRSPSPRRRSDPDLRETLSQLSQAMLQIARQQRDPSPQRPPPTEPQPDPRFNYSRLFTSPLQAFPTITEGQLQTIATGLHARLPQLTGRDHHEVEFILCVLSAYPTLPPEVAQVVAQRANLLHITTHHGWHNAIAATSTAAATGAVLPPGFTLQPAKRQWTTQTRQQSQPAQQTQPRPRQTRGGGGPRK